MSQRQHKSYRRTIRKTIAKSKAVVADEFMDWAKQQPLRYRLRLVWVILKGLKRKVNK